MLENSLNVRKFRKHQRFPTTKKPLTRLKIGVIMALQSVLRSEGLCVRRDVSLFQHSSCEDSETANNRSDLHLSRLDMLCVNPITLRSRVAIPAFQVWSLPRRLEILTPRRCVLCFMQFLSIFIGIIGYV